MLPRCGMRPGWKGRSDVFRGRFYCPGFVGAARKYSEAGLGGAELREGKSSETRKENCISDLGRSVKQGLYHIPTYDKTNGDVR